MKLAAFTAPDAPNEERAGFLVSDGRLADVRAAYSAMLAGDTSAQEAGRSLPPSDLAGIIRDGSPALDVLKILQERLESDLDKGKEFSQAAGQTILFPQNEVTFLPPVPRPGKIIALGMNYKDHLDEGGDVHHAPIFPMAFIKVSTTLTGHLQPIQIPRGSTQVDYEVEVAMVVGQGGANIAEKDWKKHIFGYTILNDVSEREVQLPELKSGLLNLGKNFPTFGPMGPWVVTVDEVPNPEDIEISCTVNDEQEPRQSSNTKHLIFGMSLQVAHFSRMGLEPGDVIATGTPSGVAVFRDPPHPWWLKPGDEVRCEASGIGTLVNPVTASE
jgi:2-keto-4-pentenoate hydratase/2-oxohepta-3-ene-1,7-dioic acid hydratase in catechol pathway